jgi:LuxR family maltose regulon positive regulatory protein
LVLIAAPSGSGKSTYLHQWVENNFSNDPIAPLWFAIRPEDNHPSRFLNRLLSEFAEWNPGLQAQVDLSLLDTNISKAGYSPKFESSLSLSSTIEIVLTELINKLSQLEGDRFLILENYHHFQDAEIHRMIAYLIDYLPPNFHLIITSQDSPPLQIPRLRARRELLEIGPEDLH